MQTTDIITSIKAKHCLWDKLDMHYKNKVVKENAWIEVYKDLCPEYDNMTSEEKHQFGIKVTKKWYNIRDAYVKSLKSMKQKYRYKPYAFSDEMSFLRRFYDKFDEGQSSHTEDQAEEDNEKTSDHWLNEVFVVDGSHDQGVQEKRPKLDESGTEDNVNVISILSQLIEKEEDEDRSFFKSITPHVKSLSVDKKIQFRIEVLKLLKTLRSHGKERKMKVEMLDDDLTDEA